METHLKITGMSCAACVGHVSTALKNVPGVERAMVSLDDNHAFIEHDTSVSPAQLIEAVVEDGYEAEIAA